MWCKNGFELESETLPRISIKFYGKFDLNGKREI